MEISLQEIVFFILAAVIVVCSVLAVTTKRILRSATHLLFVLFGLVLFFCVSLVQERKPERATFAGRNVVVRWGCYFVLLAGILCMGAFEISMVGGFAYAQY